MNDPVLTLNINDRQLKSLTQALSFYEQLCRGDLFEIVALMQTGVVTHYSASNEPQQLVSDETLSLVVRPILHQACDLLGYPPGERLKVNQLHRTPVPALLGLLKSMMRPTDAQSQEVPRCVADDHEAGRKHIIMPLQVGREMIQALECYTRVGLGQMSYITEVTLFGDLLCYAPPGQQPTELPAGTAWGPFNDTMKALKRALGHAPNGSYGIGHPHVHESVHMAWDIAKVANKALALHQDPDPAFRDTRYDGIIVRYTREPDPVAQVLNVVPEQKSRPIMRDKG